MKNKPVTVLFDDDVVVRCDLRVVAVTNSEGHAFKELTNTQGRKSVDGTNHLVSEHGRTT